MSVELKGLRSTYSGAPLEPPRKLGDTVLYDPYSGSFEALTTGTGKSVTPRYSEADESARAISERYVKHAVTTARGSDFDSLQRATSNLENAVRNAESSRHMYPEASLDKNPRLVELRDAYNYVQNMLDSAKSTPPKEGGDYFVQKGLKRIRELQQGFLKHGLKIKCPNCNAQVTLKHDTRCPKCGLRLRIRRIRLIPTRNMRHLK